MSGLFLKVRSIGYSILVISLLISCNYNRSSGATSEAVADSLSQKQGMENDSFVEVKDTISDTEKFLRYPKVNVKSGDTITSPFTVQLNSMGLWHAHEGEVGEVRLYTDLKKEIVGGILYTTDGDWMKSGPAHFSCTLTFKAAKTQTGTLRFYSNPGPGEGKEAGVKDSFDVAVIIAADE